MTAAVLPGWWGKLPALGDFAGRRLPPLFVEPWDRWLAAGLGRWRDADAGWLDAFLVAPVCRFALGAGVPFALSPGYAGVLMPSVDRVGRYFPLTLARPRDPRERTAPAAWLRALEALALTALDDDWDAQRLDDGLACLDVASEGGLPWPHAGRALWWSERDGQATRPLTTVGLPAAGDFAALFADPSGGRPGEAAA